MKYPTIKTARGLGIAAVIAVMAGLAMPSPVWAGKIFLTGHDPDFHAQNNAGAKNLLQIGLDFATNGTTSSATEKFLFVTARPADLGGVPGGHLDPVAGLLAIGLTEGIHFDVAHAGAAVGLTLDLSIVDFSAYTAIAVSSSFGGLLRRAELDGLIARKDDIKDFVNAGGGVFASSECDVSFATGCGVDLINPAGGLFGYLPITATSVPAAGPFVVQAFGTGLGLVNSDMNSPTHNSFSDAAGLNIVDIDSAGVPTTLAGDVLIDDDGFIQFRKELTGGPRTGDPDEIDIVIEVGQLYTSVYDFTMTYSNPGGPPVLIVDTAPAEWIVTYVGGESVDVDACGESDAVANGFGSAEVFKNGTLGRKCRSSTKILWTPDPDGGEINVVMETRQSPGKNNVKFAPTSCGPLFLNSGLAKVFEVDPATGEPLRDPATGELLPPLFTAEPLVLAAVKDLDGGGVVADGSGDEDGDGRTDIEEVRDFGSNPCLFSVDLIIDRDGIASEFVGPLSEQEVAHGDLLTGWPTGFGVEGIDGFDNDFSGDWSAGDDIHLEDERGACKTAGRNAVFDDNATFQDCRVRDDDLSLTDGQFVDCDFESGTFCGGVFLTGPSGNITFQDSGGSAGLYDNAEDIVLDVNKNGIFD